jgi:hypothetical protein
LKHFFPLALHAVTVKSGEDLRLFDNFHRALSELI